MKEPPVFNPDGGDSYSNWKNDVKVWCLLCKYKDKTGPAVYISLKGDAKDAVRSIDIKDLATDNGVDLILKELDKIYLKDETTLSFCAIKIFVAYRRTEDQTFKKFIVEFNNRLREVKKHELDFDDGILAYFLLTAANLTEDHERLVRATSKLTFNDMKDKLQKVFGELDGKEGEMMESKLSVKEDCFYANNQSRGQGRGRGGAQRIHPSGAYGRDQWPQRNQSNTYRRDKRNGNSIGTDGKQMRCFECESTMHLSMDCPHKRERLQNRRDRTEQVHLAVELTLVAGIATAEQDELLVETLSKAVLDCGCTKTVAGQTWVNEYLSLLNKDQRDEVMKSERKSRTLYRFGDGKETKSLKKIKIPMFMCGNRVEVDVEVVDNNIPLLLGRPTMTLLGMNIDFGNHCVEIGGRKYDIEVSHTGHYVLPVSEFADKNTRFILHIQHLSTYDFKEKKRKAEKLHRQFAHASRERLLSLLKDAGCEDREFIKLVEEVCSKCEFCQRYRHPKPKPIVSLPKAKDFNQVVMMDLKEVTKGEVWVLHMVDCATRYTAAAVIKSKKKEVIVKKILQIWMAYFGSPCKFHSDCGGEFNNEVLRELNEMFGIETSTTPGEAPWNNGIVERGNTMLYETMMKTKEDVKCNLETALAWAVCAKNSLMNVYGYSPNQLVFGRNVLLPSVENSDPPALDIPQSEMVRNNLNALHNARENFVKAEASERLKRALKHNIRTYSEEVFDQGEKVFYKKRNDKHWRGPGKVLGMEGNFVLIRHGASYHRCHPCRLIKKTPDVDNELKKIAEKNPDINDRTKSKENNNHYYEKNNDNGYENDSQSEDEYNNTENYNMAIDDDDSQNEDNDNEYISESYESEETRSIEGISTGNNEFNECSGYDNESIGNNEFNECSGYHNESTVLRRLQKSRNSEGISTEENECIECSSNHKEPVSLRRLRNFNKPGREEENVYMDIPRPNTTIQYTKEAGDTNKAHVLSVQGKSDLVNLLIVGQDEPTSIDWNQVSNWKEVEITENILTLTTREEYDEEIMKAKEEEFRKLKENDVFECVKDEGQKTVSCRWVFQEKKSPDGSKKVKARLVARGFEERLADKRVDSPTCSRQGLRLTFMAASTMNWEIQSMDISSAFLQGNILQRTVFVKPPKEIQERGTIWKLKRCLYGLSDAPREWYDRVCSEMKKLGGKVSLYDKCVFLWHKGQQLEGIITTHVDDFEYAGTLEWQEKVIGRILKTFKISRNEKGSFKYIGLSIEQNGTEIFIDQNNYCLDLKETKVNGQSNEELNLQEKGQLRAICGQVLWATSQTRPDAAFETCQISNAGNDTRKRHLVDANKVIRKLKKESLRIVYPSLGQPENIKVTVYGDGSHASLPSGASQGGNIVFVTGGGRSAPISWR